jgi:hypothetical protein
VTGYALAFMAVSRLSDRAKVPLRKAVNTYLGISLTQFLLHAVYSLYIYLRSAELIDGEVVVPPSDRALVSSAADFLTKLLPVHAALCTILFFVFLCRNRVGEPDKAEKSATEKNVEKLKQNQCLDLR